jgi:hypothetical protein
MDYLYFWFSPLLTFYRSSDLETGLRLTCVCLGLWCIISTFEWLSCMHLFKSNGLLSWRILSLRNGCCPRSNVCDTLFSASIVKSLLIIRVMAGFAILSFSHLWISWVSLLILIVTSSFLTFRTWLGTDGADEMGQICSIGAFVIITGLLLNQFNISLAGILLIAGQLTIAYFVAGFTKLLSFEWRSGRAIISAMGTYSYGHPLGAKLFSSSKITSVCFCWGVIAAETLFPMALLFPRQLMIVILGLFFLFHLSHAYFIGLNTFVWSFASAYPSIILLNSLIGRHTLGLAFK